MDYQKKLETYIDTLFENSPYELLAFQKKAILEWIHFFLYSFYMKPLLLRAMFDDEIDLLDIQRFLDEKWGAIENSTYLKNMNISTQQLFQIQINNPFYNPFPVYSMDVGIGKTIIWVLSMVGVLHCLNAEHLNISIVIPQLIKPFYEEVIKNFKLPHHFTFITNPEDLRKKELIDKDKITSKFLSKTHIDISKEFDEWIDKKSLIKRSNIKKAFKLDKHQFLCFALIDEFTSPLNPLWHKKETYITSLAPYNLLNYQLNLTSIFWFWLSASKQHIAYGNHDNFVGMPYYVFPFPTQFLKKEEVLEELTKKGLYHNHNLFIKHFGTSVNEDNNFWELYTQMQTNLLDYETKKLKYAEDFNNIIMGLANGIDLRKVDAIIAMIEKHLKLTLEEEKRFKQAQKRLKDLLDKLKMSKFYSKPIEEVLAQIPFSEIQDQKTLILLDENWDEDKTKEFIAKLIEKNHNILTLKNYQESPNGILVGTLDELGRWGNFQDFHNLIIAYISDASLEDIHQFFWRIDRINSIGGKKNVFVYSYFWDNNFIEEYLENRKDISSEEILVEVIFKEKEKKIFNDLKIKQQGLVSISQKLQIELTETFAKPTTNCYEQEFLANISNDISSKIKSYLALTDIKNSINQKNLLNYIIKLLNSNKEMIKLIFENELFQN